MKRLQTDEIGSVVAVALCFGGFIGLLLLLAAVLGGNYQ